MRLPELRARPQRAERPSMDAVRPTDLGLGAVAQEVAAWRGEVERTRELEMEVQRVEDDKAIEPIVQDLQSRFETQFSEKGAAWDGVEPGFARGIDADFDAYASSLLARDDLPPGQRDALQRRVSQYREATGQRAIQYEAQRRGALVAEQAQAREATALGLVMATYTERFGTRKAELDAGYDGSTPDYTVQVLAAHDAEAQGLIEAAPAAMKPRIEQSMATRRLTLMGQAMDVEAQAEQGFVANQVKTAGGLLVNGVLTAPSLYESAISDIDQIVGGLPRAAQAPARAGLTNDLTEAYVDGLIRDGQQDTALARLNDGSLDARLNPDTKARLLARATQKSEELSVDDWMARLRLEGAMEDDIRSREATGVGTGVDVGTVATVLGEREAAAYQIAVEKAEQTRAGLAGFGQMTAAQIRERVASMAPVPGQAGYADAQATYATAARAAEAELKARDEDPAAWALMQSPELAAGLSNLGNGDVAAARRQAGAYAAGQRALQETAGIPAAEQRVLPKAAATGLVAAAEQNADPAQGLRDLGAVISAFAPPTGADGRTITAAMARQRMVINELKAAGADNGDIAAAVDLADNPVLLGRYVAATRGGAFEAMKPKEKDEVADAVSAALGPYLRSFQGVPVSAALTGGRRLVAERLAAERIARRGGSVRDAAAEAAELITQDYKFVGASGWRMPRAIADRRQPGPGMQFGQTLAQRGAARTLATLTRNDGAGFYAPADRRDGQTEAQRRERYADSVTASGRWMTTPDDAGLVLMHPNLDGQWTPALDRNGRAVTRSWDQLIESGGATVAAGGRRPTGAGPRGIRNSNPGNIKAGTSRWQGQVGVDDDGFAVFATPEQGLRALSRDIGTKMARGQTSVRSILTQYAPEEENDTEAYIVAVARAMGVDPNARLDRNSRQVRSALMGAIVQHENGRNPYSGALIAEAALQGMRR